MREVLLIILEREKVMENIKEREEGVLGYSMEESKETP